MYESGMSGKIMEIYKRFTTRQKKCVKSSEDLATIKLISVSISILCQQSAYLSCRSYKFVCKSHLGKVLGASFDKIET